MFCDDSLHSPADDKGTANETMASPRTSWLAVLSLCVLTLGSGCWFTETSYPLDPNGVVRIAPPPKGVTMREWLVHAHKDLQRLLPRRGRPTLLTDDLSDADGRPIDAPALLTIHPDRLETLWWNFGGLSYSARAISMRDDTAPAPPWPGFRDLWVPIREDFNLSARLGMAVDEQGRTRDADCVVILPGLCGSNNVLRLRDLAHGLRDSGFHVLALEIRGLAQTDARYPHVEHTWGAHESMDLLIVADWLQRQPHIRRTGMVAFSWSSNIALMTAWADGRDANDPNVPPEIAKRLAKVPPGRRYEAGLIAMSPALGFEAMADRFDREHHYLIRPATAGLQATIRQRMVDKKYENPNGNLWRIITEHCGFSYPGSADDCRRYLRLLPYRGLPAGDKLGAARVPVLIVHGANDPIVPVQTVADLMAAVDNPMVAAIVLPTGGHIGFAPFARDWYFSTILNFFDPVVGPAAASTP